MQLVLFCACLMGKKECLDIPEGMQKPQTQAAVVAINCTTEGWCITHVLLQLCFEELNNSPATHLALCTALFCTLSLGRRPGCLCTQLPSQKTFSKIYQIEVFNGGIRCSILNEQWPKNLIFTQKWSKFCNRQCQNKLGLGSMYKST